MRAHPALVLTSCALLLWARPVFSQLDPQSLVANGVPKDLQPWAAWVLAREETLACPVREDRAVCLWPGLLALELDAKGGRFALDARGQPHRSRAARGPGRWPLAVRVNGKPAAVVARGEVPVLKLQPGKQRVEARFQWPHLPESLPLPAAYGRIALSVQGKPVARPKRDEAGSLWLQGDQEPAQQSQLEVVVQRRLIDGVPMRVETRLRLRAAGQPREVDLGSVLLAGSVPMALDSELPARLDAAGDLRLQVRAGSFKVRVLARLTGAPTQLTSATHAEPWPKEEAWVWSADEALRQVKLSGVRSVDAARLDLDPDWVSLPAYLVAQAETLVLTATRRGDPEPIPNQLKLQRTLWLDQDGRGYTIHDELNGEMHSGFRLDLRGFTLGRAALDGRDQLVTQRTPKGPSGVEVRQTQIRLAADWRADELFQSLPAVAWSEDVRSLGITLNMPPGYALFGAQGVDRVDRSWVQDWDLLGFFFVLLLTLGTARVAGLAFGVIAFVALGISYHEPDAPTAIWIVLLVVAALLRVVPDGKARTALRAVFWFSALGFAAQALPFATRSLREAIYPQLGEHQYMPARDESFTAALEEGEKPEPEEAKTVEVQGYGEAAPAAPPSAEASQAMADMLSDSASGNGIGAIGAGGIAKRGADVAPMRARLAMKKAGKAASGTEDPDAVVQTGPGLPDWGWQSWKLSWSGPVERDHRFELWIMPPKLTRSLCVLRVLLCALLAYGLVLAALKRPRASKRPPPSAAAATAAGIALALVGAALPARAHAQFPQPELLQELRTRLIKPAECRPNCVAVSELQLNVSAAGLELRAEVHAQDKTSVRVAGPVAVWAPQTVRVDGADAPTRVLEDGFLHVRVTDGVHSVEVRGALPPQDAITLRLGDVPAHTTVDARGYEVTGVREDGTAADSIELKRMLGTTADDGERMETVTLPAWLTLSRELDLGVEFRVHSTLTRETPLGSPVVVRVPLLNGEFVNDARVLVNAGQAIVTLGPDEAEFAFESGLTQRPDIELNANRQAQYSELWRLRCGTVWQCTSDGLVPVARSEDNQAVWVFRPWPGERLHVRVDKPKPAAGQSTTVDSARLRVQPGVRQTDATLEISMRTSRGGVHSVQLPQHARVRSLSVAGASRPVHNSGQALAFTLLPGPAKVAIALELPVGMSNLYSVPALRLDSQVVNARTELTLPPDTWLLWLRGPAWGPAILFWGYLALAIVLAVVLARIGFTPLSVLEWVLLAFGLTQVDSFEALAVIGFFFAFAWRARTTELGPWRHNLLQLGLVIVTLTAAGALFDAVQHGLLVQPDMQVSGGDSNGNQLVWYVDRSDGSLPTPSVVTAPLWVYRALMLLWSLWLASRLLRWLPWAFRAFVAGGAWKRSPKKKVAAPPWAAPPPAPPAPPAAP